MPPADSPPVPPPFQPPRRKWQFSFSLRTLMLGMTGCCLFMVFITVVPTEIHQLILGAIWIAASGWVLTGVILASGDERAFCIGAAVVVSSMWTGIGGRFMGAIHSLVRLVWHPALPEVPMTWIDLCVLLIAAIANGYLCIRARRYFERHAETDE